MSVSEASAELNHARWRKKTAEERAAHGRRMRLGLVYKELGRHDLDPAIRERIVTTVCDQVDELTDDQRDRLTDALFPSGDAA